MKGAELIYDKKAQVCEELDRKMIETKVEGKRVCTRVDVLMMVGVETVC